MRTAGYGDYDFGELFCEDDNAVNTALAALPDRYDSLKRALEGTSDVSGSPVQGHEADGFLNVSPNRVYIAEYLDPLHDQTGNICNMITLKGAIADKESGVAAKVTSSTTDELLGRTSSLSEGLRAALTRVLGTFVSTAGLAYLQDGLTDGQVTARESQWVEEHLVVPLNAAVKTAANANRWTFLSNVNASTSGELTDSNFGHHGFCASTPWVRNYDESKRLQGNINGTAHPNNVGHGDFGAGQLGSYALILYNQLHTDLLQSPQRLPQSCAQDADCTVGACHTYFVDLDGDGFGGQKVNQCDTDNVPPPGAVKVGGDCCDLDEEANPSEPIFRGTADACGSFDWNCDGVSSSQLSCQGVNGRPAVCGEPCLPNLNVLECR